MLDLKWRLLIWTFFTIIFCCHILMVHVQLHGTWWWCWPPPHPVMPCFLSTITQTIKMPQTTWNACTPFISCAHAKNSNQKLHSCKYRNGFVFNWMHINNNLERGLDSYDDLQRNPAPPFTPPGAGFKIIYMRMDDLEVENIARKILWKEFYCLLGLDNVGHTLFQTSAPGSCVKNKEYNRI